MSKEGGGPVALNHSLTFCRVRTLSNTHRMPHDQGLISWMRAISFGELLSMQLAQIPYTETEKSSIGQCYAGGIPYKGPYGEALLGRGYLFHASGV